MTFLFDYLIFLLTADNSVSASTKPYCQWMVISGGTVVAQRSLMIKY